MVRVHEPVVSDSELIERIAGGDRPAFEELYRRYSRTVLGLALRRLGDRGRAEDATQDAFVAIWRSARTYNRGRGKGAPWLYAVARNAITDGLRRTPDPTAELQDGPGGGPDPSDRAEAAWTAWRVHRALEHTLLEADAASGYGAGWHAHLDQLDGHLEGEAGPWQERFEAVLPQYRDAAAAVA
jgi:DNA-directed RNA polymerase specialized sigma24 family protein